MVAKQRLPVILQGCRKHFQLADIAVSQIKAKMIKNAFDLSSIHPCDFIALTVLRGETEQCIDRLRDVLANITLDDLRRWESHGVLCVIFAELNKSCLIGYLPQEVRDAINRVAEEYQGISARYLIETQRVIESLQGAGIVVALLKDMRAYDDPALRQSYDMDLLIAEDDDERSMIALVGLGYRTNETPLRDALDNRERGYERVSDGLRFCIDVHFQLLDQFLPDAHHIKTSNILNRLTTGRVGGINFPTLAASDFLINACIHAHTHETRFPSRLIAWYDIALFLRTHSRDLDWAECCANAESWHVEEEFCFGLRIAIDLLGCSVPEWIRDRIRCPIRGIQLYRSLYAYLTFAHKYYDDCLKMQLITDQDRCVRDLRQIIDVASKIYAVCLLLIGDLDEQADVPVCVRGRPSRMFFAESPAFEFGSLEILVCGMRVDQILEKMQRCGFRLEPSPDGLEEYLLVREERDYRLAIRLPRGDHPFDNTWSSKEPTIKSFLNSLGAHRKQVDQLSIVVRACRIQDLVPHILSHHINCEIGDLIQVVDLVRDTEFSPIQLSDNRTNLHSSQSGQASLLDILGVVLRDPSERKPQMSLLDMLDNRTSQVEALSKFLGTPGGIAIVYAGLGKTIGARIRRWINLVMKLGPTRVGKYLITRHYLGWRQDRVCHRVPAREWLKPDGQYLIANMNGTKSTTV